MVALVLPVEGQRNEPWEEFAFPSGIQLESQAVVKFPVNKPIVPVANSLAWEFVAEWNSVPNYLTTASIIRWLKSASNYAHNLAYTSYWEIGSR